MRERINRCVPVQKESKIRNINAVHCTDSTEGVRSVWWVEDCRNVVVEVHKDGCFSCCFQRMFKEWNGWICDIDNGETTGKKYLKITKHASLIDTL